MPLSLRQSVERFHLVFLRALFAKSETKTLLALKGGSNLRFFFGSVRFSEDIDFDVSVMSRGTLKNKVDRLLRSPVVTAPLKTHKIEIVDTATPKQTDTTQRWKIGLRVEGIGVPVRTKIEFSRRDGIAGAEYEAVARECTGAYGLTPFLVNHYGAHAALEQKIRALALRAEPQARDVFDLNLLFSRSDTQGIALPLELRTDLSTAIEAAMSISYDAFVSKVVVFLEPAQAELFQERDAWRVMQDAVVSHLEAL